jgi:hypothetical protein
MALDGTYTGLKASVADWLARNDLTSQIPDFITIAEATIGRSLRVREMVQRATATIDDQYVDAPTDFEGPISLRLTDGTKRALDWIDLAKLEDYQSFWDETTGVPARYTVLGTSLVFSPAPSGNHDYQLIYYASIPSLDGDNETNWLLTKHPDMYLWGALTAAAPFLEEDPRVATWGALFVKAVDDANRLSLRQSTGAQLQIGIPYAP